MLYLQFNDDALDTYIWALNKMHLYTVNIDVNNDGYPHEKVVIIEAKEDVLMVCETDDDTLPIMNSTWEIPYEAIRSITVI